MLGPLAACDVERGACGGEAGPQGVRIGLVDADVVALVLLPLLEQRTELVRGGTPVGVLVEGIRQRLGLLHDHGALRDRLRDGGLAGLRQRLLLRGAFLLQRLELGLDGGQIADDGRLFGLGGERLDGFVDFTRLHVVGLEPVGEQVELLLQVQVATGVQRQGLFLGCVGELADLALAFAVLDEHGAVIGDAAECLGCLDVGLGEAGRGRCRSRRALRCLLGESGRTRRMRLHRRRARNGRFAGLGCGRRCLLGGFVDVFGRGDILVGHGQLL